MASFAPNTDKIVTSSTGSVVNAVPVDSRDMLARLLADMGLFQIIGDNNPPANKDLLWYHIDVRSIKRYDGVLGNWFPATANQIAMHIARRAVLGAQVDVNLENGDLFTFWDVSLGEVKTITRQSLMVALGALRTVATSEGIKGGGTLDANRTLTLDLPGLIAKAAPLGGDVVGIYSVADGAHRKATLDQIAAGISVSDYLHSEMFFLGMM